MKCFEFAEKCCNNILGEAHLRSKWKVSNLSNSRRAIISAVASGPVEVLGSIMIGKVGIDSDEVTVLIKLESILERVFLVAQVGNDESVITFLTQDRVKCKCSVGETALLRSS
ncbi:hypothetical protein HAX54_041615 [Datura stramonium]|uniref:Uncharacterized protein n=1 Tax=Datura stramonium TaxID=4076 RepID=A0ABS8SL68_DATST|nr:hypothetical protein [Datura stramonium]